jgi:hypothetical protein
MNCNDIQRFDLRQLTPNDKRRSRRLDARTVSGLPGQVPGTDKVGNAGDGANRWIGRHHWQPAHAALSIGRHMQPPTNLTDL